MNAINVVPASKLSVDDRMLFVSSGDSVDAFVKRVEVVRTEAQPGGSIRIELSTDEVVEMRPDELVLIDGHYAESTFTPHPL